MASVYASHSLPWEAFLNISQEFEGLFSGHIKQSHHRFL